MRLRILPAAAVLLAGLLTGCGSKPESVDSLQLRSVVFPSGKTMQVELAMRRSEVLRGLKFREPMGPDRGLLMILGNKPTNFSVSMYEVKMPLDLIWMDGRRSIVQLLRDAPPCAGPEASCKYYGGGYPALYILEAPAGTIARNNLKAGMTLEF